MDSEYKNINSDSNWKNINLILDVENNINKDNIEISKEFNSDIN